MNENEPTELKFLLPQGRARLPGGTPVTGRRSGVANFALSAFLEPLVSMVGRTAELTITVDFSRHARSFAAKRGQIGRGHWTHCYNLQQQSSRTSSPPGRYGLAARGARLATGEHSKGRHARANEFDSGQPLPTCVG